MDHPYPTFLVKIDYFKPSGKWYSEAEFRATEWDLSQIWEEVETHILTHNAPGLAPSSGGSDFEFNVLINVPGHPHNHPHFLMLASRKKGPTP